MAQLVRRYGVVRPRRVGSIDIKTNPRRARKLSAIAPTAFICLGLAIAVIWLVGGRDPPTIVIRHPAKVEDERRVTFKPDSDVRVEDRAQLVSSLLNVPQPMRYGDYIWDDKGIAPGTAWIRVDLDAQIMSVFRAGHEIGTAVILYGADKKPTPAGHFPVIAKLKNHQSSLYDAAMPYTLRLTKDGIAIHGSDVQQGLATNGCIGIPKDFAAKLFDEMRVGSNVVILRNSSSKRTRAVLGVLEPR